MLQHPVQSLYVGTFPMGAMTLISVATTVLHGKYGFGGRGFLYALWAFWWVDIAVSALCCWGIIYVMLSLSPELNDFYPHPYPRITKQQHSLREMSALWLLPVITLVVASSGGAELAQALTAHTTTGALTTLASTACTLSVGLGLASALLVIYLYRLIVHGFPTGSAGVLSACVPLGPMGQSGVAALLLGEATRTLIPVSGSRSPFLANAYVGECVYAVCVCAALALWALATLWLGYALLGIQYNVRRSGAPPFQLAYWGLIFPNVCPPVSTFFSRTCFEHTHTTGRICEPDNRVGASARFVILPRLGRNLCRIDVGSLDRRLLTDGCTRTQWTDIRRSVLPTTTTTGGAGGFPGAGAGAGRGSGGGGGGGAGK
jgi:tellurite resistance protein TehA-like permease